MNRPLSKQNIIRLCRAIRQLQMVADSIDTGTIDAPIWPNIVIEEQCNALIEAIDHMIVENVGKHSVGGSEPPTQ